MQKKIKKVIGDELLEMEGVNFYYDYCEEEILIIQLLLLIMDKIRKVVKKLEV